MRFNSNLALGNQGKKVDIHDVKRWADLESTVNNNIEFGSTAAAGNIKGAWVTVTTPATTNTDFTVNHNLGTVPNGVDLKMKSIPADIYTGSVSADKNQITLRSTAAGANLTLFIH